jgi:hypothetical protein
MNCRGRLLLSSSSCFAFHITQPVELLLCEFVRPLNPVTAPAFAIRPLISSRVRHVCPSIAASSKLGPISSRSRSRSALYSLLPAATYPATALRTLQAAGITGKRQERNALPCEVHFQGASSGSPYQADLRPPNRAPSQHRQPTAEVHVPCAMHQPRWMGGRAEHP